MNLIRPVSRATAFVDGVIAYALDREGAAAHYYDDAVRRYQKHDDNGTVIQLKNALQQDPKMLPALLLLGQVQLRNGDPAGVERVFADAEKLPDLDYLHAHQAADPRGNYLRALYFNRKGDEATARTALAEVTRVLAQTPAEYLAQHDQRLAGCRALRWDRTSRPRPGSLPILAVIRVKPVRAKCWVRFTWANGTTTALSTCWRPHARFLRATRACYPCWARPIWRRGKMPRQLNTWSRQRNYRTVRRFRPGWA